MLLTSHLPGVEASVERNSVSFCNCSSVKIFLSFTKLNNNCLAKLFWFS